MSVQSRIPVASNISFVFLFQTCITKSRERKGLMKSTKDFWSKKQFDNASQYSDHWLISRTHHARGKQAHHSGYFCLILSKYSETLTNMVAYGSQISCPSGICVIYNPKKPSHWYLTGIFSALKQGCMFNRTQSSASLTRSKSPVQTRKAECWAHPNCQKILYKNDYKIQIHACTPNYVGKTV